MTKRILMIIAPNQFRDEELIEPRNAFLNEGWQVDLASTQTGISTGMLGAKEPVEKTLDDINASSYDAAVVVGGMGSPEFLWNNTQLHDILKTVSARDKVVSAICLSGAVLANAGLLDGKSATVWPDENAIRLLKEGGANYSETSCIQDGNIITANGPEAATAFGQAIVSRVKALTPA